ncbi:signal transduction histidine kinase [Hydrogenispora ethanolica]|jgi:signal transduction histidine kinase|uniref:histidine kinase n=1 Tax=Hydrogenispora ethanolica TaxID=1082276 RepID=A0A4R1R044_HYDET|nr:HAMP domain-containing sensor histidine kinase [Hydrogenispora ethanolica]TCL58636.1 signal transduction histidine kinase [Hydrogenispora ethanolica]
MKRRSIFYQQLFSHLTIILFMALSLAGMVFYFLYHVYHGNLQQRQVELRARIVRLADLFEPRLKAGAIPPGREWQLASQALGGRLWLEDFAGRVIGGTRPPQEVRLPQATRPWRKIRQRLYFAATSQGDGLTVATPVALRNGRGKLIAYYSLPSLRRGVLKWLFRFYIFQFGVGLTVALLLGVLLARKITRSIADIAAAAAGFAAGDYQRRTRTTGPDELGQLGRNFNAMAEAIVHHQKSQSEFFTHVSHDLKTPLSCIKATTEALLDGIAATPRELQRYLQNILRESDHMSRLVHELLETARLEAGQIAVRAEPVDLEALLKREAEKLEALIKEKQLALTIRIGAARRRVLADPSRLEQVLDNLLSNAIRYSPPGAPIEIAVLEDEPMVQINIRDHGEGIAEAELPLIWERFYRTDKSRGSDTGGSGLGLFICRGLVEAMGGSVNVQSAKGKGSVFMLRLPAVE